MLPVSNFTVGSILWLPKQRDITSGPDLPHTVPPKCFGHPILLLAADLPHDEAQILIITSFGGSVNIDEKIRNRRHQAQDYLPIHPAVHIADGTPSLALSDNQRLTRDNWIHVVKPYRCSLTWLERSWSENWAFPKRGKRVSKRSLELLSAYAKSRDPNHGVWKVLESRKAPSQAPQPCQIAITMQPPQEHSRPTQAKLKKPKRIERTLETPQVPEFLGRAPLFPEDGHSQPVRVERTSEIHRTQAPYERVPLFTDTYYQQATRAERSRGVPRTQASSERTPLLPRSTHRQPRYSYGTTRAQPATRDPTRPSAWRVFFGAFFVFLLLLSLFLGVCYGIYYVVWLGIHSMRTYCSGTVWPAMAGMWQTVIDMLQAAVEYVVTLGGRIGS
ncbi:hypothetical protein IQ07DRAFT_593510 [Pyrenochaeta sp. DS3sAY3a]|nr:hypothetical protein IQ07DRAFT_593510 [Pyrenochaeta sp. DS3sAY3a]